MNSFSKIAFNIILSITTFCLSVFGLYLAPSYAANDKDVITMTDAKIEFADDHAPKGSIQTGDLSITIKFPKGFKTVQEWATHYPGLKEYLMTPGSYRFFNDWPALDSSIEVGDDNPPFKITGDISFESLNDDGSPSTYWDMYIVGQCRIDGQGRILLADLPRSANWNFESARDSELDPIQLYWNNEFEPMPRLRGKFNFNGRNDNLVMDFSFSGRLSDVEEAASRVLTLCISGKLPILNPSDTPNAPKHSSGEVTDVIELSLNSYKHKSGGGLQRMGLKARATSELDGVEAVVYWAPVSGWFQDSNGFYGMELEAGYREGDAEWTSLTIPAPDRGNMVARVGAVLEFAPELFGVNKNLGEGLRFFVRGRGWADLYDNDVGDQDVRFREFIDSELFYNFSEDWRIFLRGEWGYLPPDLSRYKNRIYVGVGSSF